MEANPKKRPESMLPGTTCSMYDPQAISNQAVALGLPHRAKRCRPRRIPFSSPGYQSCQYTEVFLYRTRVLTISPPLVGVNPFKALAH